MNSFEHERLDAYQIAIDFLVVADAVGGALPRGRTYLNDQLRRAAASIPVNIAEGAGEFWRPRRRASIASLAVPRRSARRSSTFVAA